MATLASVQFLPIKLIFSLIDKENKEWETEIRTDRKMEAEIE